MSEKFKKILSKFAQTLIYYFKIVLHEKNFQVWANSNNFLLNKIFVLIFGTSFAPDLIIAKMTIVTKKC